MKIIHYDFYDFGMWCQGTLDFATQHCALRNGYAPYLLSGLHRYAPLAGKPRLMSFPFFCHRLSENNLVANIQYTL